MVSSPEHRAFGRQRFTHYADNPRAFVYDMFRDPLGRPIELEPYQVSIMEAVAAGRDVTVRSGHGVGKTTTDALTLIWFLTTRPFSKVPTTAPTFRQVKEILWAEVAKWYQGFRLKDNFRLQKTRLSVKGHDDIWFATGVASNRQENIEGFHAPHILFIVDEAKGVQKPIFDSIDGALTTGGQRLYTSTPGSRAGTFYDSHHGRLAKFFHTIHVNGEHSRRVSEAWRRQKEDEWGRDSPIYQAKIMGEFPNEGTDILIRLDWILAAEAAFEEADCKRCRKAIGDAEDPKERRHYCQCEIADPTPAIAHGSHRAIGLDVARYGMDDSAAAFGSVSRLEWIRSWGKTDTTETAGRVTRFYREQLKAGGCDTVGVDDTGLGGGVTDMLIRDGIPTTPVIFGSTSSLDTDDKKEHYVNNKAWMAWKFRKALEENAQARDRMEVGTFGLVPDDKLKGQLSNLRIRHNDKGRVRIIDPDDDSLAAIELPKGVRVSPDRAHAAMICYHVAASSNRPAMAKGSRAPSRAGLEKRRVHSYIFGGRRRS